MIKPPTDLQEVKELTTSYMKQRQEFDFESLEKKTGYHVVRAIFDSIHKDDIYPLPQGLQIC